MSSSPTSKRLLVSADKMPGRKWSRVSAIILTTSTHTELTADGREIQQQLQNSLAFLHSTKQQTSNYQLASCDITKTPADSLLTISDSTADIHKIQLCQLVRCSNKTN